MKAFNLLGFQAAWWGCALFAGAGQPWLSALAVLLFASLHLGLMPSPRREALLLLGAAGLGFIADSALVLGGQLSFPTEAQLGSPTTLWMVALWIGFAATLRVSFGWLRGRLWLSFILGALAGPLAYRGGASLGALTLPSLAALIWVALEWALAFPLLLILENRLYDRDHHSAESLGPSPDPGP